MQCENVAGQVMEVYGDLDRHIEESRLRSGLHCIAGCGACCESTEVEATIGELLPLAFRLWHAGTASERLRLVEGGPQHSRCVLYEPTRGRPGFGRCGVYPYRPLVCRLFGFSTRLNKQGTPRLVTCRLIRRSAETAEAGEQPQPDVDCFPIMGAYATRVYAIEPSLGRLEPINEALRGALTYVGFRLGLQEAAAR